MIELYSTIVSETASMHRQLVMMSTFWRRGYSNTFLDLRSIFRQSKTLFLNLSPMSSLLFYKDWIILKCSVRLKL